VERLAPGARTRQLELWLSQELTARSEGRILTVDVETATRWGGIVARAQTLGRATEPMDAFIAATAERHDLTLVTRNVKDFDFLGIPVINPWSESV
jgi:predicted nucleic acid-binding protein